MRAGRIWGNECVFAVLIDGNAVGQGVGKIALLLGEPVQGLQQTGWWDGSQRRVVDDHDG